MSAALDRLKSRLLDVYDLNMSAAVLRWDQATYMPPGGAPARGRQLAILSRLAHETFVDADTGRLLDAAAKETEGLPYDGDEASLVRVTRRDYERATRVPASFVGELQSHMAESFQAWIVARPANDFPRMVPFLQRTLELSRRYADFFPGYQSPADPLIDLLDHGMTAASIKAVFGALRERLVPLVRAIAARPMADNRCLMQFAPASEQLAFGLEVIRAFGYDFERGRQDLTHHPFMTKFSLGDVRITTRVREQELTDSLFSTLHESGHAMYEQGIRMELEGSPLADGASAGVHESQSRLWENLVGRSRAFWTAFYPKIQAAFPKQLQSVPLETFYAAINRVERSLIRTDADEVTYNLHVMLRFDLELDMLEGRLPIPKLAEAWRERFRADFGIPVPDDRDGVLQDVHWYQGSIGGMFQGYTLGNIMSAQFFEAARRAHPGIPDDIASGRFGALHGWLRENVYQHGAKFTAAELIERATGEPMTIEPYMRYLWGKFQSLYQLEGEPATTRG